MTRSLLRRLSGRLPTAAPQMTAPLRTLRTLRTAAPLHITTGPLRTAAPTLLRTALARPKPAAVLVVHRRAFHPVLPGVAFLLKAAPVLKFFEISTTWFSLVVQRFRNAKVHGGSDETLGEWWRKWMGRATLLGSATLLGAGGYVYVNQTETVAVSGRRRLLLTTRDEEIQLGKQASKNMSKKMKKALLCELKLTTGRRGRHPRLAAPPAPLARSTRLLVDFGWWWRGLFARLLDSFSIKPPDGVGSWGELMQRARRGWMARDAVGRRYYLSTAEGESVLGAARRVVGAVLASTDLPDGAERLDWKLHVVEAPSVMNACVLPNGHIYVFTGILPSVPSEDTLGFLLGHEAAQVPDRAPSTG